MNVKRKEWIRDKSELTRFEQSIINAYPENLVSATAEGKRGIGKSMFAFKTATRIFQFLEGVHVDDAYIRALDHFLFTVPQILNAVNKVILNTDFADISKYDAQNKYRLLVCDDAGTHMSKYRFYTDVASVDDLKARLDTIRDITCGLILTTPVAEGLLSFLRDYPDNKTITIRYNEIGNPKYDRIIYIRNKRERWARKGRMAYPAIETSIYIDDWAYNEYKARKRKALIELFKREKTPGKNNILKMFATIKKLNPSLSYEEIAEKLSFSQDVLTVLDDFEFIKKKQKDE